MKSMNQIIVLSVLFLVLGIDLLAGSGHLKTMVSAKQRQALLMRLSNVKNSLFRIKSDPMHRSLRSQTLRLQQDFRKKDKKQVLTMHDVDSLHAKAAAIQCKINCAVAGKFAGGRKARK